MSRSTGKTWLTNYSNSATDWSVLSRSRRPPWMQRRGIPPAWFGLLWAAAHLWLAVVSLVSARVAQAFGLTRTLLACCALAYDSGSATALLCTGAS